MTRVLTTAVDRKRRLGPSSPSALPLPDEAFTAATRTMSESSLVARLEPITRQIMSLFVSQRMIGQPANTGSHTVSTR